MNLSLPQEIKDIFAKFEDTDHEIYLVGGAVRDLLMGKIVTDWDFTTDATPEEIQNLFPDSFYENDFGTVGIEPESPDYKPHEITTFRREHGYTDKRRPDKVEWGESLEEDLERRDFTINAIALRQAQGKLSEHDLIDPHHGQNDIDKKLIRAVGDPVARFNEDALRMMRAVRQAAELGFEIEHETFEAIKMHAESIKLISSERVRDELLKIIASNYPYEGVVMFKNSGLMGQVIPELEACFGVEQKSPGRHHIFDVGTHCLMSLKNCKSTDPITRFATLIHDIGKPRTVKKREGIITFYNHEMAGARIATDISKRLRFSKKQADKLYKLVRWHQFTVDERQTDSAIRRFIKNVGKEYAEDMLALRVGDRLGGGARETSWRLEEFKQRLIEVQKQPFSVHDLKISGTDVMAELDMKPGPKVGEILNKLFEEVVEKKVENEKKALVERLKDI